MASTSLPLYDEHHPYIKGRLVREIFHNPENMYTVSIVKVTEATEQVQEDKVTVVGNYPPLLEGEVYTFWGKVKEHPRFGKQYLLEHYRKEVPHGKDGVTQYLSSDLFPGVGKKTAQKIVETLGENAIQLMLENPDCLDEVPQLPHKVKHILNEKLLEYQGLEQVMVKLSEYGIGLALSTQIYQKYEHAAMEVLRRNPYQLIEDVEGIGFKRADAIAAAMGIRFDAPERIQAACIYFLWEQAEQNGHVYVPLEDFLINTKKWLNDTGERMPSAADDGDDRDEGVAERHGQRIDELLISDQVIEMGKAGKIMIEDERVYLPSLFYAEKGFAKKVKELCEAEVEWAVSQQEMYAAIGEIEERLGIEYAPTQREAIERALQSSLLILTGGPGTGKTTVIKGICEAFASIHDVSLDPKQYAGKDEAFPLLLVAPTGRAAKRMEESTGIPAVTIHRLLGWQGGQSFEHDEDHPIAGRLLIVDEVSMMDQWLANQLFRTLPEQMQVLLVGDEDQLPSVGPGQVLKDLLDSGRIPVVELKDIFRQAADSSIITLAHHLKQGEHPGDMQAQYRDRRFFPAKTGQIVSVVRQVCASAIRKGYTPRDIQVLAPMYKGEAGIDALNKALQEEFNPPDPKKRELQYKEQVFRIGDKVLQLANNPEENVFNGDIGEITAIEFARENVEKEDRLIVSFDLNEVAYKRNDLQQLTLAYCCSVHKSQGSEFPIVVLPVIKAYYRMLRRNLIYTAITRGKDYLILCGEEAAFEAAVRRNDVATRYSFLKETIQEWLPADACSKEGEPHNDLFGTMESNPRHDSQA